MIFLRPKSRVLTATLSLAGFLFLAGSLLLGPAEAPAADRWVSWEGVNVRVRRHEAVESVPGRLMVRDSGVSSPALLMLLAGADHRRTEFSNRVLRCGTSDAGCTRWTYGLDTLATCLVHVIRETRVVQCQFSATRAEARFTCSGGKRCSDLFERIGLVAAPLAWNE